MVVVFCCCLVFMSWAIYELNDEPLRVVFFNLVLCVGQIIAYIYDFLN